ncbi:MAG: hypothetical protein ACK4Z6_00135 [Candidatus Methylomirabilales bacterium]
MPILSGMLLLLFAASLQACALLAPQEAPIPGAPKISAFRIEPSVVRIGEEATFSFQYEARDADLVEAHLIETEIRELSYTRKLQPIVVDLRAHLGQFVGKVEIPFRWETEGIRFYEVYVVDTRGNQSNRLRTHVTVK